MTMTLIETQTLGTATTSITFSSIPQTYTDLQLFYSVRDTGTNGGERSFQTNLSLNGSTTGFTCKVLYAYSGTGSQGSGSYTRFAGWHPDAATTSNTFGNTSLYLPNYTGSTNKSYSIDQIGENNEANIYRCILAGLWSNTAAITSLTLTTDGTNLAVGSMFSLYGILKGSGGATVS